MPSYIQFFRQGTIKRKFLFITVITLYLTSNTAVEARERKRNEMKKVHKKHFLYESFSFSLRLGRYVRLMSVLLILGEILFIFWFII